jgi:LCP family protein required for cell wall assembly
MKKRERQQKTSLRKYELVTIIIFAVMVCLLAFIITTGLILQNSPKSADASSFQTQVVLNVTATVTPTPFQPVLDPSLPTFTAPAPTDSSPTLTPTNTPEPLKKPEGQVNILLMGSDLRPDDGGFRTDVIMWASLNPNDGFVSVVSFPRDLYVNVPGRGNERINTPFQFGGFDILADTFETNFGVRPDHYVLVDFNGFKTVVDNLGGINVQTAQNLTDVCPRWINPSGECSVGPGLVHMDGELALWYARARHSTSDFDRARRAQEVTEAVFRRLMSLDAILKAGDLYNAYTAYVQTDLVLGDILPLLPLASQVHNTSDIRRYVIGPNQVTDWTTPQGAMVLLPHYDEIEQIIIEALALE